MELCEVSRPRGKGLPSSNMEALLASLAAAFPRERRVLPGERVHVTHTQLERRGNLPREQKGTEEFSFGHHYVAVEVPSSFLGCLGSG